METVSRNCSRNFSFPFFIQEYTIVCPQKKYSYNNLDRNQSLQILRFFGLWSLLDEWVLLVQAKEAALFFLLPTTFHSCKHGEQLSTAPTLVSNTKVIPPTLQIKYRMSSEIWISNKEQINFKLCLKFCMRHTWANLTEYHVFIFPKCGNSI